MEGQNQQIVSLDEIGKFIFDDYESEAPVITEEEEESNTLFQEEQPKTTTEEKVVETTENQNKPELPFSIYAKVVKDFIEDETWDDYKISHEGKEYESLLDLMEEVEVTEELFKGLVATQSQGKIDNLKEKAIILDDSIDPTREQLLKTIAGGLKNYQPFVDTYDNFIEPLKKLDLSEERNAINLIAQFYKEVNKWDDGIIDFKIKQHVTDLEVVDVAENIRKQYIDSYEQILKTQDDQQKEIEKALIEEDKKQQKEFKSFLKEAEYEDPFISKAIPLIFAKENGEPHWVKEIKQRMNDSKEFKAKLSHWLLNEEDYINKKMAPLKREQKLKTIEYVNVLGAATKKRPPTVTKEEETDQLDITGKKINT